MAKDKDIVVPEPTPEPILVEPPPEPTDADADAAAARAKQLRQIKLVVGAVDSHISRTEMPAADYALLREFVAEAHRHIYEEEHL